MALPSEAAAPTYALRRLRPDDRAERERLFQFIRAAWGAGSWHADRERWEWQILRVPPNGCPEPPLWILTRGDEIIGQVSAIPVRLSCAGGEQPAAWASDLMILPEYWNRGGFPLLMREMARAYPVALVLGMNRKAYALFQRSPGWRDLGVIPRRERYCSLRALASPRTLVALVRQAGSALRALGSSRPPRDLVVRSVARFDDRVTALWDRTVGMRVGVRRSAVWLNWKYAGQPLLRHERLQMERGGVVVGCAVLRVEPLGRERRGYLVECFAEPAALGDVAAAATAHLRRLGVDRITCDVLDPATESALGRLGYVRRRSGMKFMLRAGDATLAGAVADRARWYVTRGDADQDRPR
jgi:GNAT acetyltransferase-like protein